MKKQYKFTLETLTPVHIGNGNELTPLDYNLVEAKQGVRYVVFSTDKILNHILDDSAKMSLFENASSSGNMKALQNFFHKNMKAEDIVYLAEVTKEFSNIFEKNLQKDPYENAAKVLQIYRPAGTKNPVIPGSAIKGSIRTAVINKLLYDVSDENYEELKDNFVYTKDKKKFDSILQKKLMNDYSDAKRDPFRSIEILDCTFEGKGTQQVGVLKNISSKNNRITALDKMQMMAETIKASMDGAEVKAVSKVRINEGLQNINDSVSMKISIKKIIESCNEFYMTQFDNEYEKFYNNTDDLKCDKIAELKEKLNDIVKSNSNSCIIRIGRWSQVEFVTFGGDFRTPKTRIVRGKPLGYGGTRTVFNADGDYLPMGWCKCTFEEIQ